MVLATFSLWQAVLVAFVTAVEWDGPKPTASGLITSGPAPRPTDAPDLRKRDAWPASFCGFVGASSELAVSCSQHSSCVWNTDWFVVGCCATASRDCLFYTSCIDDTSPSTAADDSLVFTCRGTKTCYENNYPSNYRQWGCGYNATFIALTYSNMSVGAATIQQAFIGTAELADVTTVTTTASPTSTSTSQNSKTSTGTIVGAAVGGAAILVIGGLILAWLLLRRKKNNIMPGNSTMSQPTSPSMSSPAMAHQNMMGFHHSSAGYFPKDQNIPHSGTGPAHSHNNTLHSDSNWSQPTQFGSGSHTSYHTYSPPQSPPRPPQSPGPREMDGNNAEIFDMVRKPVPIRSNSTNNVPSYESPSAH